MHKEYNNYDILPANEIQGPGYEKFPLIKILEKSKSKWYVNYSFTFFAKQGKVDLK